MDVRPLSAEHVAPLEAFFRRVPESDHNSFAEDVLRPGIVESWLSETRPRRAVYLANSIFQACTFCSAPCRQARA